MNPYSYSNSEPRSNSRLTKTTQKWLHYTVDFPTARPTRHEKNNTVRGDYYQPRNAVNAPLLILFHGAGDESLIPCKLLARALAKKGMACFVLYSVLHSRRMPEMLRQRFPNLTPEEWFEEYQTSVIDVFQVMDWAASRDEINGEQIAVLGISFGGFISAITMGIDKRIKAGILITAGGNTEKIGWKGRKYRTRNRYKRTEEDYHRNQVLYQQYLAEVAERGFENVNPPLKSFLTDPMTFAHYLQERSVLMINALWDEYIPKEATLDFWEACGNPPITWLPGTHSSIWLWYPLIRRRITRFLESNLDTPDGGYA